MSEKELIYLKDLVRFREDLIKLRVALGNRIGAKKDKNGWVFLRRYTVCKNKHAVLLKEDEKRDKCPVCGEPVTVVEETPSDELIQRFYDLLNLTKSFKYISSFSLILSPPYGKRERGFKKFSVRGRNYE